MKITGSNILDILRQFKIQIMKFQEGLSSVTIISFKYVWPYLINWTQKNIESYSSNKFSYWKIR